MERCKRGLIFLALLAVTSVHAQVQCQMPNGVVVTKNFGDCPPDSKRIAGEPREVPPAPMSEAKPALRSQADAQSRPLNAAPQMPKQQQDAGSGLSFIGWLGVILLGVALIAAIKGSVGLSGRVYFCTTCGHEGKGRTETRGMLLIEIILWCCMLVPGLIYSAWRHGSKHKVCAQCGASTLVPPNAPIAIATKQFMGGAVPPDASVATLATRGMRGYETK